MIKRFNIKYYWESRLATFWTCFVLVTSLCFDTTSSLRLESVGLASDLKILTRFTSVT